MFGGGKVLCCYNGGNGIYTHIQVNGTWWRTAGNRIAIYCNGGSLHQLRWALQWYCSHCWPHWSVAGGGSKTGLMFLCLKINLKDQHCAGTRNGERDIIEPPVGCICRSRSSSVISINPESDSSAHPDAILSPSWILVPMRLYWRWFLLPGQLHKHPGLLLKYKPADQLMYLLRQTDSCKPLFWPEPAAGKLHNRFRFAAVFKTPVLAAMPALLVPDAICITWRNRRAVINGKISTIIVCPVPIASERGRNGWRSGGWGCSSCCKIPCNCLGVDVIDNKTSNDKIMLVAGQNRLA